MKRLLVIDPRPTKRDHLLLRWKELGYHVTGVTPIESASGFQYCDDRIIHPFLPVESLIATLKTMPTFDGVICYHQAAINVANNVAHALGLRPMWKGSEQDLSNKIVVHTIWENAKLPVPQRFRSIDEVDLFPVIVKPAGLQGQIGVKLCRSKADAHEWIEMLASTKVPFQVEGVDYEMTEMYASDRSPLIQELIVSDPGLPFECSAEFLVVDGEVRYLGGFDKTSVDDPDLPNEELLVFPHVIERELDLGALVSFIEATGYQNGFCHLEYKVCAGKTVPIELNARLIGSPADECLSAIATIDIADLMARTATGQDIDFTSLPNNLTQQNTGRWRGYVKVHLPRRYSNRFVTGFTVPEFKGIKSIYHSFLKPGEAAALWESCVGAPIGMIHFEASSRAEAREYMEKIGSNFNFEFLTTYTGEACNET